MTLSRKLSEPDPEVIRRAAAGDSDALYALLRALQEPIFGLAVRMLRHRADAEDATQEALLRIVTHLGQFRSESRFSTWAWRIAVNRILDLSRERAGEVPTEFEAMRSDLEAGREPHAPERAEDAVLLRELKVQCSRAMLQCLGPDERIAFTLGDVLDLSSEEAAEVLDIERAAFRKRLSRARASLQQFLTSECGVYNPAAPCRCHRRLSRALELGRVVPRDVAVVAICPDDVAERSSPALSSVQIPAEALGRRAVELLMAKLDGQMPPELTLLPPVLTGRFSV